MPARPGSSGGAATQELTRATLTLRERLQPRPGQAPEEPLPAPILRYTEAPSVIVVIQYHIHIPPPPRKSLLHLRQFLLFTSFVECGSGPALDQIRRIRPLSPDRIRILRTGSKVKQLILLLLYLRCLIALSSPKSINSFSHGTINFYLQNLTILLKNWQKWTDPELDPARKFRIRPKMSRSGSATLLLHAPFFLILHTYMLPI